MDDLKERIIRLESVVAELDAELLAHQHVLAWLLNTFHHPQAARFLSRLTNELEESGKNKSIVRELDELRGRYDLFDDHRKFSEADQD